MRVIGTMRATDEKHGAVRMEDTFDTKIDDLWSAVTDPDRLARWIAAVEGDFKVGGEIFVRFTSQAEGPGRIDVCEAPTRLVVTMDPGTPDEGKIEAQLTADGDKTKLVIDADGLPLDNISGYGAGWNSHLDDLVSYLAGEDLKTGQELTDAWYARLLERKSTYDEMGV